MAWQMRWLGTACFEILLPDGKTLVIDPYLDDAVAAPVTSDQIEHCDYIFITHGHYDHVLDVGKLAGRFQPKIFCSETTADSLARRQGVDPGLLHAVTVGDKVSEPNLTVEVLRGVHVDFAKEHKRLTGKDLNSLPAEKRASSIFGPVRLPAKMGEWMANYRGGEQLNYVFEPADGPRIYMAGSYPDPELVEVAATARADVTLLQVMANNTLRGLEEQTTRFALASGCRIVIPQHHDPLLEGFVQTDVTLLKQMIEERSDIVFKELEPGAWYDFD